MKPFNSMADGDPVIRTYPRPGAGGRPSVPNSPLHEGGAWDVVQAIAAHLFPSRPPASGPPSEGPAKPRRDNYEGVCRGELTLPGGVSEAEWEFERVHYQDPRLRVLLDCLRLLDQVLAGDYSILHSSPAHLQEMWAKTRTIAELITGRIAVLLETPSCIPKLQEARSNCLGAVNMITHTTLQKLAKYPNVIVPEQEPEVRRLLCVCIGQLQDFLPDVCGQLVANDPRSPDKADYYFSRDFLQRMGEAEYLLSALRQFQTEFNELAALRPALLTHTADRLDEERIVPDERQWGEVVLFLDALLNGLTPKLKHLLSLRGVRVDEIEILDRYAMEFSRTCNVLKALYDASREATDRATAHGEKLEDDESGDRTLRNVQAVLSRRMTILLRQIDGCLRDLAGFLPLWLQGIERRRALFFGHNSPPGLVPSPTGATFTTGR